jgi:O-methyltransferase
MKSVVKFCKDLLLFLPLTLVFQPLSRLFLFLSYFNKLLLWIMRNKGKFVYSDYFSPVRDYTKRYQLYQFVNDHAVADKEIVYLEYGVAAGESFRWWMQHNQQADSRFFGFDTFEGLPEKWGAFYGKGDMHFNMPELPDARGQFIKGLFQDTLTGFIARNRSLLESAQQRVILLDADLYSATIFTLSQLYPFLKKGDIIMFDEFNVAMHEFKAYTEFVNNFYIDLKPLAAVNNFYQTAFEVA